MPNLLISVNAEPAMDGSPLIAVLLADPFVIEDEEGVLAPGLTVSPATARALAQIFLDIADEAEMRC
jgi:hypothetical protein